MFNLATELDFIYFNFFLFEELDFWKGNGIDTKLQKSTLYKSPIFSSSFKSIMDIKWLSQRHEGRLHDLFPFTLKIIQTKCHVVSCIGFWIRKRTLVEKRMKSKYWSFVNSNVPMLV